MSYPIEDYGHMYVKDIYSMHITLSLHEGAKLSDILIVC